MYKLALMPAIYLASFEDESMLLNTFFHLFFFSAFPSLVNSIFLSEFINLFPSLSFSFSFVTIFSLNVHCEEKKTKRKEKQVLLMFFRIN